MSESDCVQMIDRIACRVFVSQSMPSNESLDFYPREAKKVL